MDKKYIMISKKLSSILRHTASKRKINIDSGGWISLDEIFLNCIEFKNTSLEDILYIVNNSEKNRFSIEERNKKLYIKANQGHSIKTIKNEILLKKIISPDEIRGIVHGTYKKNIDLIKQYGLCRMKRNHIHFAKNEETQYGIRKNAQVFIYIDVDNAMKDGITFFESVNEVILSPGIGKDGVIPSKYLNFIYL